MKTLRITTIAGARPNFMKIAPLVRAFRAYPQIEHQLVHTGQHYDESLSGVFFEQLGIPAPDYNLEVGSWPREEQIARISGAFMEVVRHAPPDAVLVVGDVNSTVACARVAKEIGAKAVHVEAGLRSFDLTMPEEHNRRETDALSDLLFVTEESGMRHLQEEEIKGKAFLVGNVMIDTLTYSLSRIKASTIVDKLGLASGGYAASTFHRPSNVDTAENLSNLLNTIEQITERLPLVLPLHPRTKGALEKHSLASRLRSLKNLLLIEPLGYFDFMQLVMKSKCIITDSGGIQEETTYLGIPCITTRENTERPVTVELGTNVVVGTETEKIINELDKVIAGTFKKGSVPPLWDGHAAERIAEIVVRAGAFAQNPTFYPFGVGVPQS